MNPTPSPERPEHNPDGLTPEQYGAPGWRLLRDGERVFVGDSYSVHRSPWLKVEYVSNSILEAHHPYTYRRRVATRTPAPEQGAGERCHECAGEPCDKHEVQAGIELAIRRGWSAAITLANNVCVDISDRYNRGDDADGCSRTAAHCANQITRFAEPDAEYMAQIMNGLGATPPLESDKDAEIASLLPDTFYAHLPTKDRVAFMVHGWQKAIIACQQQDADLTTARATIADRDKRIADLEAALKAEQAWRDATSPEDEMYFRIEATKLREAALAHAAEAMKQP